MTVQEFIAKKRKENKKSDLLKNFIKTYKNSNEETPSESAESEKGDGEKTFVREELS